MALTASEAAYARKLLAQGEQRWHHWVAVRWLVVVVGLALLCGGATLVRVGQHEPEEPATHIVKGDAVLPAVIDGAIARARTEAFAFAMACSLLTALGVGLMATGVTTFGYGVTHWNAHLRDGLLCKALREKFHDELGADTPAKAAG